MVPRIVILCDSITNPVFESQVQIPLLKTASNYSNTIIISFEKDVLPLKIIEKIRAAGFQLIIKKRLPFITQEILLPNAWWVRQFTKKIGCHVLFARGPHAGYIALNAMSDSTKKVLIQARGLCAEEYTFFKPAKTLFAKIRYWTLYRLEKTVYSYVHEKLTIEAVSPALKEYVMQQFQAVPAHITIAQHDIPNSIEPALRTQWHTEMRQQLSLADEAVVYCYNGSAKPWQCAQESIEYFKSISDPKKHLLILSADKNEFEIICSRILPKSSYTLLHVPHEDIYRYLAIANFGILFRTSNIVNWVSRPTKYLEYQAVGLKTIHNKTIAYLVEGVM